MQIFTLQLKETNLKNSKGEKLTYRDYINACVDSLPQGGLKINDVEQRLKIRDAVKENEDGLGDVIFDETTGNYLKALVSSDQMAWAIIDQSLLDFCNDVKTMELHPLEK